MAAMYTSSVSKMFIRILTHQYPWKQVCFLPANEDLNSLNFISGYFIFLLQNPSHVLYLHIRNKHTLILNMLVNEILMFTFIC